MDRQKLLLHAQAKKTTTTATVAGRRRGAVRDHGGEWEAIALLRDTCKAPPRYSHQMIAFSLTLTPRLGALQAYVATLCSRPDPAAAVEMAELLWETVQTLTTMMCLNVGEMWVPVQMTGRRAWALLMCIFVNTGALLSLWRSCCDSLAAQLPPDWDTRVAATDDSYVLLNRLCVTTDYIEEYTTTQLIDALTLLSARWHRLDPGPRLRIYLQRLFHRGGLLAVQPGTAAVHDDPDYRVECPGVGGDGGEEVFRANDRLVRSLSGRLVRLLGLVMFLQERESVWAQTLLASRSLPRLAIKSKAFVRRYREFMEGRARLVASMSESRAYVSRSFYQLIVAVGDLEQFVDERDLEVPDPQSVMMTVKSPEAQQAWARLSQVIMLSEIPSAMHEEDPDYFDRFSYAQHIYCFLMKIYIFDLSFKEYGFSVREKHVIWEPYLPSKIAFVLGTQGPFMVHTMGSLNVIYNRQLYRCRCVEEAIAVWCFIVLHVHEGRIGSFELQVPLRLILYNDTTGGPAFRKGDAAQVLGGEIDRGKAPADIRPALPPPPVRKHKNQRRRR